METQSWGQGFRIGHRKEVLRPVPGTAAPAAAVQEYRLSPATPVLCALLRLEPPG